MQTILPIDPNKFWLALALTGIIVLLLGIWQGASPILRKKSPELFRFVEALVIVPATLLALLWLGLFALTVLAAFLGILQAIHPPVKPPAGDGAPFGFGLGALIAALLGAPLVIWGTWLKYQTVRFQKEGHMTDRISKAVEQLGAEKTVKVPRPDGSGSDERTEPNIEVRIGAILSLERIAQDSTIHDKGRDHVRVMEILCAYVRENSNARKPEDYPEPDWVPIRDDATTAERRAHERLRAERFGRNPTESKAFKWARELKGPLADVALALRVIGRRTAAQRAVEAAWPDQPGPEAIWYFDLPCPSLPDEPGAVALTKAELKAFQARLRKWRSRIEAYKGYRLDLSGANLQGANLAAKRPDASDAVFSGAIFARARMEGAKIDGVRLEGADLQVARLEGADLRAARLEGANLAVARLEGAELQAARLIGAFLWNARMDGVFLGWARMAQAHLRAVQLEGANLRGARMEGVDLWMARMDGSYLGAVRMEGANLGLARMDGANLAKVRMETVEHLEAVGVAGAALRSIDLSLLDFEPSQILGAFGDASVTMPEGIAPPAHWPKWELPDLGRNDFLGEWKKWQADPKGYVPPPRPYE